MINFWIKILFVLCFMGLFHKANAQIDTLNYVKQFEINKAQYINQPFSYLLSHMTQIQPKTNWSYQSQKDLGKSYATAFKFCDMDYSFHNAVTLYIKWQEIIPTSQIKYYEKKNGFYFTNEEKNFYSNKIIKDITVFR
ncbi:hypothetical protein [Chryseobacterium nepalense]|uniref:hypothetical protein n=1 Tax=Chryseobacterium nepalense TaxID=1854498 RepID=UPI002E09CC78|nr:hypothetical protein [Chryseobacterium nepalense]